MIIASDSRRMDGIIQSIKGSEMLNNRLSLMLTKEEHTLQVRV